MKLLLALLLTISSVTSWSCRTWGCRTWKKKCWDLSCGVESYLLNQDSFIYWWKPAVRVLKLEPSKWKVELEAAKAKHSEEMDALQKEVEEVKASNEALATESSSQLASLKAELVEAQTEIEEVRADAASSIAEARRELKNLRVAQRAKELKWTSLNADLRTDVGSLKMLLEKHNNDSVRSLMLWPTGCGWNCATNYKLVYGIWARLAVRLGRKYALEWAKLPCSKRITYMRKHFLKWCQPYPEPVRVRLMGYYDYLVASRGCSW